MSKSVVSRQRIDTSACWAPCPGWYSMLEVIHVKVNTVFLNSLCSVSHSQAPLLEFPIIITLLQRMIEKLVDIFPDKTILFIVE